MLVAKPHDIILPATASILPPLDNKTYSQLSAAAAAANIRNPHDLPDFSTDEIKTPSIPILYLPPLLSLLPDGIAHDPVPSPLNAPLTTETRMPDIDPASLSLHKALHLFSPLGSEYARIPYAEGFNWADLQLSEAEEREWYCVAFRSRRKPGSDSAREFFFNFMSSCCSMCSTTALYEADRLAHEEAVKNGGVSHFRFRSLEFATERENTHS
jgi:hypothetical protein